MNGDGSEVRRNAEAEGAVPGRVKVGSLLARIGERVGEWDFDARSGETPREPPDLT